VDLTYYDRHGGWLFTGGQNIERREDAPMKGIRSVVVQAAGSVVAVVVALGVLAGVPAASAQAPTAPMPNDTCTAKLTLDPSTIPIGGNPGVSLLLSGFEPGALFSVFVGSHYFGGGIIASDGTGATGIFVDAFTAAAPTVQATTSGRCAVATLTIAGPLRVSCDPVIVDGIIIACPLTLD
jgi:hypothetical protein